jgi:beta-glucanase (GH16 family)
MFIRASGLCAAFSVSAFLAGSAAAAEGAAATATGPAPVVERDWKREQVSIASPAYCSTISGDTPLVIRAPGLVYATVTSWMPGPNGGTNTIVGSVSLDDAGHGTVLFPAKKYPHGPIDIEIEGTNGVITDRCYLQLFNTVGVPWNEGMPKAAPPEAEGMTLIFADDFNAMPTISTTDMKATYYDHKPPDGSQDFSSLKFTGFKDAKNPFSQVGTWLRIRADQNKNSAGLLSSIKNDASGVVAQCPCYFECRFIGPNAKGAWPAFWLLSDYMTEHVKGHEVPCDELDIIEAYGGQGNGSPNSFDWYCVTPHAWSQGQAGVDMANAALAQYHGPGVRPRQLGVPAIWYETPHLYGCKITPTDTIYYCDHVEVARHKTMDISKTQPFFFLINLATEGGWPVDLSRYDGICDMYVDYVRVYSGNQVDIAKLAKKGK